MKRWLFWFCILLIAPLQSVLAAIAIDNTSSNLFSDSSSLTVSHTTGSGSDRFMLVGVSFWNEDLETVSSVTYGGATLTRIGSVQNADDSRVEIWKLVNPSSGTANVSISFSSRVQMGAGAGVMTFTGVDQSNPHDAFQSDTGLSGQALITVPSASGDLVFSAVASEYQNGPLRIDEGTERWNVEVGGNNKFAGAGGTRAGSNGTTSAWTLDSFDDWAIAGVSINPSAGGGSIPDPILEYQMDELLWQGAANEVIDNTGNAHDGQAQGGASTVDNGAICRAGRFDGTDDYVSAIDLSVLRGTASLSYWVKTSQVGSSITYLSPGVTGVEVVGSTNDIFWGWLDDSGQVGLSVGDDASTTSASAINNDSWRHVVLTRNASTGAYQIFIDGSLSASGSVATGTISTSFSSIGRIEDGGGTPEYFQGQLDEILVFDETLTQDHVTQIYTNQAAGRNWDEEVELRPCPVTSLPTPLAEFRLDETSWDGSANEVEDSVGSYHGTAIGSDPVAGKICRAADLSATDTTSDYLRLNGDVFANQGDFTISSWVKTSNSNNQSLISGANASSFNELIFWLTGSTNFQPHLNDTVVGNVSMSNYADNTWRHLVWVRSGTQNCLYLDKVLQGCSTANSTNINIASNGLIIGQEQDSLGGGFDASQGWEGLVDELIFFDEALNSAEVDKLYDLQDAGKNLDGTDRDCPVETLAPVADWRFDESSWGGTNDVLDSSGNDYHGSAIVATPDTSTAQLCNSVDLTAAGTTDYLSMNKDAMDGLSDFTVIVWAKTTAIQDSTILSVASADSGLGANEAVFYFENNNRFWPTITSATFQNSTKLSSTTPSMRDGDWHQLAWTRKASSAQSCFIFDGVSQGCVTHTDGDDTSPLSVLAGGLIIGQDQDGLGDGFDGSQNWEGHLDEFLIFDSVLSESQISNIRTNIMNSNNWDGTPRVCGAAIDHYSISHDGAGVTCLLENITISAHDSAHSVIDAQGSSINLSTTSNKGDWIGIVSGGTGLNNGTAGDGEGSFTFSAGATSAVLTFAHPILAGDTETFGFNVTDGTITEESGSATALDDPDIDYSLSGFRIIDASGSEGVVTQISGKASDIAPDGDTYYLQAVQADEGNPSLCLAAFSGQKTIKMAAQCDDPATCVAGQTFNIKSGSHPAVDLALNSAAPSTPSSYSDVVMTFDGEAKAPLVFTYSDAGLMELHASFVDTDAEPAAEFVGSSQFVVRPFALGFTEISADGEDNLGGDETGGDGFTSAGSDFEVSVNAYRYLAIHDTDSDGVPDDGVDVTGNGVTPNFEGNVELAVDTYTPSSGTEGVLSGGTTLAFTAYSVRAGAPVTTTLQYDEVGSFNVEASHSQYLGDIAGDIFSVPEKVGRFYPDHFVRVNSSVTAACTPYTYMQQPFSNLSYELEARPKGVTDATAETQRITQNYSESLLYASTAVMQGEAENNNSGDDLSNRFSGYLSSDEWVLGVYSVDRSDAVFLRDPSATGLEDGPFDNLQLGIGISSELDNRGFESSQLNMKPDENNDCASDGDCTAVSIGDVQILRYGRLEIKSAHGPETEDIAVPFVTQYWDGTRFMTNIDDNCTAFPLSRISFDGTPISPVVSDRTVTVGDGSTVGSINTSGTDTHTVSGGFNLQFTAPGVAATGSDNTGYFPVSVINLDEWLRYDWDQDGNANDSSVPDAIITFGRARGNDRMIFWQERYQ